MVTNYYHVTAEEQEELFFKEAELNEGKRKRRTRKLPTCKKCGEAKKGHPKCCKVERDIPVETD